MLAGGGGLRPGHVPLLSWVGGRGPLRTWAGAGLGGGRRRTLPRFRALSQAYLVLQAGTPSLGRPDPGVFSVGLFFFFPLLGFLF